ncbi:MAG: peptide deformylase [Bacteroidetes bacterium]|jgi:peptide deformylase|nr:peptide deformylase [Bacteroidota bacterium]
MILPITSYGNPILKKKAMAIDKNYPNLEQLIANMFETMYAASGVGLAAPQIGLGIRLFVIDAKPFADDEKELENFKRVFINAQMLDEDGNEWKFNEGCLSIPGIREDISRRKIIRIRYQDENFETHEEIFSGLAARVIQHEYDHIEGVLFVDKLSPLKKQLLKGKLRDITIGRVDVDYRMKFPVKK